jgi:ParB-like chromosome segregation protein Spo0J
MNEPFKIDSETPNHLANIVVSPSQLVGFKHGNVRRKKRNQQKEAEILESMKIDGIRDQVKVWIEDGTDYLQILGGYGRVEKALKLGIEVPCKVFRVAEVDALRIHLQDNTQREDLSFVEEVDAAKQIYTHIGGDFEETRMVLGWTKTKLRERLEIAKCSPHLKSLISDNRISLGHAILLAPYPHNLQDQKADDVVTRNITVQQLKEMLGRFQIPLSTAKFNTRECEICEFNTKEQLGLFGNLDDGGKCRKNSCFKEKTNDWLESVKQEAESRYGKILFLSQIDNNQVNSVSVKSVGHEQFTDGCSKCTSNVVLISDRVGEEGLLTENQCIDQVCYKKNTAPPEAEIDKTKPRNTAKKKSITVFKPSTKLKEFNKSKLREVGSEVLGKDAEMFRLMTTAIWMQCSGYTTDKGSYTFDAIIKECLQMSTEELQKHSTASYRHLLSTTTTVACSDMTKNVITLLKNKGNDGLLAAQKSWAMTTETLNLYTVQALHGICEKSGIKAEQESLDKWDDVLKLKRSELIEFMVENPSNDPLFAPSDYLDTLTSTN